ncbi:hypothetical protein [Desulfitobacterium hafniense]|uniref:Uncharacterized protein n=3 Tax=Desulfitobacterium hafniense TaxID=49338 RepID=Q24ZW6_DESHY|nr:hypothetical protein [Desulfitobacterium hafniense]EHL09019.1 hypothetical protein HMPREF0322_00294 [Desulfitobacterium hafniense DP7]KTE90662.1 hypothetical protein AT727_24385 [Desulfitobacterium hafniense]BAE82426.1 hypothetical protein DSY0637 [Desulfitobacterium hafniense Y51]
MTRREKAAQAVRVITVPPVMVLALLLLLFFQHKGVFTSAGELLLSVFFLSVIPLLAYPFSRLFPRCKAKGRDGQRNLAFTLSLIGYAGAVLWGMIAGVSGELLFIFLVYLASVVILTFFNRVIGVRASGHASGITGPLLLTVYFIGGKTVIPCVLLLGAILWSSLTLKRHTLRELLLGALSAMLAFFLCLIVICFRHSMGAVSKLVDSLLASPLLLV